MASDAAVAIETKSRTLDFSIVETVQYKILRNSAIFGSCYFCACALNPICVQQFGGCF